MMWRNGGNMGRKPGRLGVHDDFPKTDEQQRYSTEIDSGRRLLGVPEAHETNRTWNSVHSDLKVDARENLNLLVGHSSVQCKTRGISASRLSLAAKRQLSWVAA